MWRDFTYFFLISRPVNVLISLVAFSVACFLVAPHPLNFFFDAKYWAASFTIAVIAATGYWINDVYDFRIDRINKPGRTVVNALLSVKKVLTIYFLINGLVLLFSLGYLGFYLGNFAVTFINFLSVFLLFFYASYFKRVSVAGNLVISFLIALVLILASYLYENLNMALIWTIVFAFEITFIREITKDIEDIEGDLTYGLNTLPIQMGISFTTKILMLLYGVFLVSCYLPFFYVLFLKEETNWLYLLLSIGLVQIPTVWLMALLSKSTKSEEFGRQSRYLKLLMLSGIITLFFL
ncbi:MAG: geranylgeranylglycerol-phosphate geranylgeranyltransferase [Bacteroidia bacterium]|nr:geranylgeranylglycerol-phosphate geranylgeranyltransferase [Bacteroidia bacterium]